MIDPAEVAQSVTDLVKDQSVPVITSWMGGPRIEKGREVFNRAGIPTFDTPERAVRAFMDLYRHRRNTELLQEIPSKSSPKMHYEHQRAQE